MPIPKQSKTTKKGGKNLMTQQNKTINSIIQTQIQNTIQSQPHPTECTITKVYEDGYVDINSPYGELRHIQSITEHQIGDETILIFLNNNYTQRRVI